MISSSAVRSLASMASRSSSRITPTLIRSSFLVPTTLISANTNTPIKTSQIQQQNHTFSTMGMMPRRGFPQYTIFDQNTALSVRAQMPIFKKAGSDGISVDRRGKLVLEFVPRNTSGTGFAWDSKTAFSLGVEEIGLCVSQLPGAGIELSHKLHYGGQQSDGEDGDGVRQFSGDLIDKVLTIEPKEGATLLFKIDYVKDGIGGQSLDGTIPGTPLEVTLQAGEFEVIRSIFKTSIPYLLGWNATMDLAAAAAIGKGISGGGNQFY